MRFLLKIWSIGWRAISEAHTAIGLFTLAGVPVVPSVLVLWALFYELPTPIIFTVFVVALAASLTVAVLIWGYVSQRQPFADSDNQYIPLIEAARRAYTETRHSFRAGFVESIGETEDGILQYYAFTLVDTYKVPIRGIRPPADAEEWIDWDYRRLSIEVEDGELWIAERYGHGRYENVALRADDLPAAIEAIRENAGMMNAEPEQEIDQLRRDIGRLSEDLERYISTRHLHEDLAERYRRIDRSDHTVWNQNPARQLRRDFLNRCGILIDAESGAINDAQEWRQNVREMAAYAQQLDNILANQ